MPNFRTAFHFFAKLEMVQENYRSAWLLESIHVIQYMIEHHFTYIWTVLKYNVHTWSKITVFYRITMVRDRNI